MEKHITRTTRNVSVSSPLLPGGKLEAGQTSVRETVVSGPDRDVRQLQAQLSQARAMLAQVEQSAGLSPFFARADDVRDQASKLAASSRLFVLQPGAAALTPARPGDVYNAFVHGYGTIHVVTLRSAQGTRQSSLSTSDTHTKQFLGPEAWGSAADNSQSASLVARYTATPVDDVDVFLSFRHEDSKGRALMGVPGAASLSPAGGETQVASASATSSSRSFHERQQGLLHSWSRSWEQESASWERHGAIPGGGQDLPALPGAP